MSWVSSGGARSHGVRTGKGPPGLCGPHSLPTSSGTVG